MSMGYGDIVGFLDIKPQFARPANGFIYNNVELDALWDLGPTGDEVLHGPLAHRWEFAQKCVKLGLDQPHEPVNSKQMGDILTRAILAEMENPDTPYTAPETNCHQCQTYPYWEEGSSTSTP